MASVVPRYLYDNLLTRSATVITPSSEQASLPRAALRNPLRSDVLRFKSGWTIVAGFNDKIDFNRSGVKVATVTAGNYATGAALATAIVTALEAADATPVWACSYSVSTFKFTISSDLSFTLLFGSGANVSADIAEDLGFAASDTSSGTSQVAGSTSYQSRHYVLFDLGSAASADYVVVINHNLSASGSARLVGDTTATPWVGPDVDQTLSGTSLRIVYFSSASKRYWAVILSDVQNSVGYGELGIASAGPRLELSKGFSYQTTPSTDQLSQVTYALDGPHYRLRRQERKVWTLGYKNLTDADRTALETMMTAMRAGGAFFFNWDSADPTNTIYAFLETGLTFPSAGAPGLWDATLTLKEALG